MVYRSRTECAEWRDLCDCDSATTRGPSHWGPIHTRSHPDHGRVSSMLKQLHQESRSSTSGERSSFEWKNTHAFGNNSRRKKSCFMGRKEEKLQKLTLSPLLDGPSLGGSLGARWAIMNIHRRPESAAISGALLNQETLQCQIRAENVP